MNEIGLTYTILLCIAVVILPKRLSFVPVLLGTFYMSQAQQIEIGGAHLTSIRIIILFAFSRVILKKEVQKIDFQFADKIFLAWVLSGTIAYILLWQTEAAFIYRMGLTYDALLSYFFFRSIFGSLDDVKNAIPIIGILIIPLAVLLIYERFGNFNVFSIIGAPELPYFDGNRIRAEGPFRHPILAGSVGAVLLPLFIAFWFIRKSYAAIFIISAFAFIVASNSSGPLLSAICAIAAIMLWPVREHMRLIRWGILVALISMHFVMKAPIWYLIARISEITGGTGWHRSYLIDRAIHYFSDWWFIGTKDTSYWMPTKLHLHESADITNEFISQGIRGGLVTFVLFILLIAVEFGIIGKTMKVLRQGTFISRFIVWSLGASLFAHTASFMSVQYFDQSMLIFFLSLSLIAAINKKKEKVIQVI